MSKRLVYVLIMMVLGALALSGCSPCDMVAPDLVSPDWREILSGDLIWSYSDTCAVDHFEIELAKDRDFSVIEHTEVVPGTSTSWAPTGLDPAYEYFWRVRAEDEGTYGPWSTERRSFFTGPICAFGDLVAPVLTSPAHGGIYDHDYDSLEWTWPLEGTCIPEAYRVEVSRDIDFVDDEFNGGTGTPGTRWGFGSTPPEGTKFYWRITPSVNDFDYGPTSIQSSFWTAPVCTAGQAFANPVTPLDNDFAPALAVMYWEYTYPGGSACAPEGFHLQISSTSDFNSIVEDITMSVPATGVALVTPLADCSQYYWRVAAISDGVETPFSSYFRFIVEESASCGCTASTLPEPYLRSPGPYQVFPDTDASIRWENPGGCFEDGVSIELDDNPFYEDDVLDQYFSGDFIVGYDPPGLTPATQYWTKIAFAVEDSSGVPDLGPFTSNRSFFTGPECTSITEVTAPVLDLPADGAYVDTLTPLLRYHPGEPGCIPDEYFINLQADSAFAGATEFGLTGIPSTAAMTDPLIDCTTYYWKVNSVQGGADGPESVVRSFTVDVDGTCGGGGVPGTAKSNNFCRKGTFEIFEADWTHVLGDKVLAIARNPFSTYLLFNILDQETGKPFENEIHCWSYLDHFDMDGPIEKLEVVIPLPTPTPVPLVCHLKLSAEDCKAAGGTFDQNKKGCYCP